MRLFNLLMLIALSVLCSNAYCQVDPVTRAAIEQQLPEKYKDLDQEEVAKRLSAKGIDLGAVSPQDIPSIQPIVEQTLEEMYLEQQVQQGDNAPAPVEEQNTDVIPEELTPSLGELQDELEEQENLIIPETTSEEDPLPIQLYGQHIFRNKSLNVFLNAKNVKAKDDYILGPGDEITVTIWGLSQFDGRFEVNSDGYIAPDRMPRIFLKGISFSNAKKLISDRFQSFYRFRPGEIDVSLNYSRVITVGIFGEVQNFGHFTLPAVNTAFNAMIVSGGPSDIGSVRNIQLVRGSETRTMDVYKLLADPAYAEGFYLESGDVINVPVAKRVVSIAGAVKRSFRYELIPGEELIDLVEYAGGFTSDAYKKTINVYRYINNARVLITVNWDEISNGRRDFVLLDGDEIEVSRIAERIEEQVSVKGGVEKPGDYEWYEGMRLMDLLNYSTLSKEARLDYAYLLRSNQDGTFSYSFVDIQNAIKSPDSFDNIILSPRDELHILRKEDYTDAFTFKVTGAVRQQGEYNYDQSGNLSLSEAILLAGGLEESALPNAYIVRRSLDNPQDVNYIRVDVERAVQETGSSNDVPIRPRDVVIVFNAASFYDQAVITVRGRVREPGELQYSPELKLGDVLHLAGGLNFDSDPARIEVFRQDFNAGNVQKTTAAVLSVDDKLNITGGDVNYDLQPFDEIVVRALPGYSKKSIVNITGEIVYPGAYALLSPNEKLTDIVSRAGGLKDGAFPAGATLKRNTDEVNGYVVINLDEALRNSTAINNLTLREGDEINVPRRNEIVSIKGAFIARDALNVEGISGISVNFDGERSARYYINNYAAGLNENADRNNIRVEYPNGQIKRARNVLFFKKYPKVTAGSTIVVGSKSKEKEEKEEKQTEPVDWGKVVTNSIAQATTVLSLILLIQRLD